ncbi:hypothetical protein SKAU_G00063290 [Synaphobranchus kaupii]|uniref:Uncharacterized protein n=1 Tax=Synaphobranchus kaupii TaxID=118154 RepID=A0A9Q1J8T3_SYNKA|nr:hypothetical protein SKAU_G00063290 [Synaphobranchus kaupii]
MDEEVTVGEQAALPRSAQQRTPYRQRDQNRNHNSASCRVQPRPMHASPVSLDAFGLRDPLEYHCTPSQRECVSPCTTGRSTEGSAPECLAVLTRRGSRQEEGSPDHM